MAKTNRIDWTEEQLESRLVIGMYAHQASGMEEVSKLVMKKAMEAFSRDDEWAGRLRELSREIASLAAASRKLQSKAQEEHDRRFNDRKKGSEPR